MGTAGSSPGKASDLVRDTLFLGLVLRDARPGQFRIGEDDRRNSVRFEDGLTSVNGFGSQAPLVGGPVSQHRLTGDVSDGEDVGLVGSPLFVGYDKPVFVELDLGVLQAEVLGIRAAAYRDQDLLEGLFPSRVQGDFDTSESVDHLHHTGVEKHLVHDVENPKEKSEPM